MYAFNIVSNAYTKEIEDNPRFESVDFTNYVKLFNNARKWRTELRQEDASKKSDAFFFSDTYNDDPGLFKSSVLEGYKQAILNSEEPREV